MANYIDNTIKNIGRLFDGSPNMKDKYESGYTNRAAYWQGKGYAMNGLDFNDPKVSQKIANLKSSIPQTLIEQVEASMKSVLPSWYPLDLIGSATLSSDKKSFCITTRVHGAEKDGAFNFDTRLNLSVEMLLEMGPIELQSVVTSMVYASIMNSSKLEGETLESLRDGEALTKEKEKKSEYVNGVESLISDYIVALLKTKKPFDSDVYSGSKDFDYAPVAKIVSSSIVAQVKESAGNGCSLDEAAHMAIDGMFDRSILENANIATAEEYESTLIHSHETRKEQLAHLVSMSDSDKEGFCRTFIQSYLESYNIPKNALQVKFDSSGSELGMFYPTNPPIININLENVKDMTDLCMTMVHEISHFMDNKSGIKARTSYGSRTEINNCGLDANSDELKLMNKLQKLCYYLDDDEKRARLSEIEALDIMEEASKSDSSLVDEVALNRKRHNSYLSKTNALETDLVSGKIDLSSLLGEINASNVSDDVKAIMEKKLRFLQQRKIEIEKERERNAKSSESFENQSQPGVY